MPGRLTRAGLLLLGLLMISGAWRAHESVHRQPMVKDRVVAAMVNSPFRLELQADGGSSASVTIEPTANGLTFKDGVISGTPEQAMILHIASPGRGTATSDTTWIVVFAGPLEAPALPTEPYRYRSASLEIPVHLSAIGVRAPAESREAIAARENPSSDAGAALGRVLFYDRRLSLTDAVSCASCHQQSVGFSDTARFSRGYNGQHTKRHSMALANVRFNTGSGFFWDLRAKTLEEQVVMPIQDPVEMGMTLPGLERKLRLIPYYPALFEAAFGSPDITIERTARALAQFLRTLVTTDSPFDRAFARENVVADQSGLTPIQREGFVVFQRSGCTSCHFSSTQITAIAMNSGLDAEPSDSGAGRGAFRAPSLRNVAIRAPYMHDGRFTTLDEVIDFYSTGVQPSVHLDVRLRDRSSQAPRRLELTVDQRVALKAFLHALTDSTFLSAPEFSDPFRAPKRQ